MKGKPGNFFLEESFTKARELYVCWSKCHKHSLSLLNAWNQVLDRNTGLQLNKDYNEPSEVVASYVENFTLGNNLELMGLSLVYIIN
jgi:hypothetical protein